MDVEIRVAASEADVAAVAPLFDEYRVALGESSEPRDGYDFLLERWRRRESVLFVAFDEATPIGFVQLYPTHSSPALRTTWFLSDLFVRAAYRRSGLARSLLARAHQHARETNAALLHLVTAKENVTAHALYLSEGYAQNVEDLIFEKKIE